MRKFRFYFHVGLWYVWRFLISILTLGGVSVEREIEIFTLDTETLGLGGDIKRCALYDGKNITYGYRFSDLIPRLEESYISGKMPHIYIHNLEFDARKMPEIFQRGNVKWNQTKIINGKYAVITCLHYILHDSFKILPEGLDSISESFGVEHAKIDLWEKVQERYPGQYKDKVDYFIRCDRDDPLYVEYLGYDVLSLYEVIDKLIEISGIPAEDFVKRISTASLSRYIMRKGYKGQIFKDPDEDRTDYEIMCQFRGWNSDKKNEGTGKSYRDIENMIRCSYCGGRTEVFTPHSDPAFHGDVNSLYPSVMALGRQFGENPVSVGLQFPVGFPEYIEDHGEAKNIYTVWMRNHYGLGFVSCEVFVPMQDIPPLPSKMGKLVFVCGHIKGVWTFTELEYAVKNCGVQILNYEYVIYFKKTYPVFERFIGVFAAIKTEAKRNHQKALTKFAKLIQNTGYGWTVLSRDDKTELKDISSEEKFKSRLVSKSEDLGYIEIESIVTGESIQPQVGAYVTSYARLVLLDCLRQQAKKGTVYYCDTDSVVCAAPFPADMLDPSKLGFWDLESVIEEAYFIQPKVYTERVKGEDEINKKFKGVSTDTQKGFTFEFYKGLYDRLCSGERGRVEVEEKHERLSSLLVAQKRGFDPNKVTVQNKDIDLDGKTKRIFDYAANTSKPWYFQTLDEFLGFDYSRSYEQYYNYNGGIINTLE